MMSKLSFLSGWTNTETYFTRRSAQSYFGDKQMAFVSSGCSSSCGTGDEKPKPAACGADAGEVKPPAAACGAGDDGNAKPAACGASCGAGDSK